MSADGDGRSGPATQPPVPATSSPNLGRQVLAGAWWSAAQKWSLRLTTLAAFIVLSRLLQPSDFGLVALASAIIAVLQIITDGGFSAYVVQAEKLGPKSLSTAFWTAMAVAVACAGLVIATAPLFARLFHEPGLTLVLIVLSFGVIITGFSSVQAAVLQRDMQFKALAIRQMSATVVGTAVALSLAFAGAGVWALVGQSVARSIVATIVLWRKTTWRPQFQYARHEARSMLNFSWKVLAGNLLYQVKDRAEQFIIAGIGGASLLGYWTVASRILQILSELTVSVLQTVLLPAFSKLRNDPPRLRRAYRKTLTVTAAVVVPVMILASQTSHALVPLVFGQQWIISADVAAIITLTGIAAAMNYFDRSMYLAHGRPGVDLAVTAVIVPLHVLVILVVSPYGLVPLAIASVIRSYSVWPFRLAILKRVCGLPWSSYTGALPVLLTGAAMAGLMWFARVTWFPGVNWVDLLALAAIGSAFYLAVVLTVSKDVRSIGRELSAMLRKRRARGRKTVVLQDDEKDATSTATPVGAGVEGTPRGPRATDSSSRLHDG